jgi:hypothetical protein
LEAAATLAGKTSDPRHLFVYDQQLLARASLARTLWLQGFADQATKLANSCLLDAQTSGNQRAVCFVLGLAVCPVALMTGELTAADRAVQTLLECATRQNLTQYSNMARCLGAMLLIERNEFSAASVQLRAAIEIGDSTGWKIGCPEFFGALAWALLGLGKLDKAYAAVDEGLARAQQSGEGWCVAELLRIRGELSLHDQSDGAASTAETFFTKAINVAEEQGALFWQLRAAMSLARARVIQGRNEDARHVLAPIYSRFTEGFETADLRSARALLEGYERC